jgi:hypothetical protein
MTYGFELPEPCKERCSQISAVTAEDIAEETGFDEVVDIRTEPIERCQNDTGLHKPDKEILAAAVLSAASLG